jgi:arsenate reductase-like glutaredoxin family protein
VPRGGLGKSAQPARHDLAFARRAAKTAVVDERTAVALMQANPTLIKRPVVEADGDFVVGFTEAGYAARFARR